MTIEIQWLQAVIDVPAEHFDEVATFWADVTASKHGPVHPDYDEYLHLLPRSGHMHLELQRIDDGSSGVHLDLLVDDIAKAVQLAVDAGARVIGEPGHVVLTSPAGLAFCIVPHTDEAERAPVIDPDRPHAVDQICLDIPHGSFDREVEFWETVTGWPVNPGRLPEFRSFDQPGHLPLRLLLQRLGVGDSGGPRAHLDISSGDHVISLVETHLSTHGASLIDAHEHWTALRDPAGMPYCLTSRRPFNF